jgi:hypothetical protein
VDEVSLVRVRLGIFFLFPGSSPTPHRDTRKRRGGKRRKGGWEGCVCVCEGEREKRREERERFRG